MIDHENVLLAAERVRQAEDGGPMTFERLIAPVRDVLGSLDEDGLAPVDDMRAVLEDRLGAIDAGEPVGGIEYLLDPVRDVMCQIAAAYGYDEAVEWILSGEATPDEFAFFEDDDHVCDAYAGVLEPDASEQEIDDTLAEYTYARELNDSAGHWIVRDFG